MCRERKRTRDRLLEYNPMIIPPRPHTAGLAMIYPWENSSLLTLQHQLFLIAQNNGYNGEETDFLARFAQGNNSGGVNTGTINTFPIPGVENQLYLDTETEVLYYFKIFTNEIQEEFINKYGIEIVGSVDNIIYAYIPVRALPMEPLFIDCGSSTESID